MIPLEMLLPKSNSTHRIVFSITARALLRQRLLLAQRARSASEANLIKHAALWRPKCCGRTIGRPAAGIIGPFWNYSKFALSLIQLKHLTPPCTFWCKLAAPGIIFPLCWIECKNSSSGQNLCIYPHFLSKLSAKLLHCCQNVWECKHGNLAAIQPFPAQRPTRGVNSSSDLAPPRSHPSGSRGREGSVICITLHRTSRQND
jgi:hypothetical protein